MDRDRGRRDRYSSRSPSRSRRRNARRNDSRERTRNRTGTPGEREKGGGDRRETVWPPAPPQRRETERQRRGDSREKERGGDRGGAAQGGRGNYNSSSSKTNNDKYVSSSSKPSSDRIWKNNQNSSSRSIAIPAAADRDRHRKDARSDSREKRKDAKSDARNAERSRSRKRSITRAPEQSQAAPPIPVAPLPPGQPPPPPPDPNYKSLDNNPAFTKSSPQKPPPAAMIPAGYQENVIKTAVAPGIVPVPPIGHGNIIPTGPELTMTTPKSRPPTNQSNSLLSRQQSNSQEEEAPVLEEEARAKAAKNAGKPLPEFILEPKGMTKLPRVKNPVLIDHTIKKKKDNQDDKKENKKEKKKKPPKDMSTKKKKDKDKDKDGNNDNEDSWPSSASDIIVESSRSEDTASNSSVTSKRERTPSPVPHFSIKDWLHPTGGKLMRPKDDPFGIKGKTTKYKFKDLNRPPTRKDPPQVQYSAHSMLTESYADLLAQKFCSVGVKAKVIEPAKKPSRAARCLEKSLKSSQDKHRKSEDKHRQKHDKSSSKPAEKQHEKKKPRGDLDFV